MTGISTSYGLTTSAFALQAGVSALSSQEQTLQTQGASGVSSDSYAGLGANRTEALALQPALTQISAWSSSVTSAQNTLTTTQTALTSISDISSSLSTSLATLSGNANATSVAAIVTEAKQDLDNLGSLLSTKSGSSYVFAGRQSTVAPVTTSSLANSDMAQSIAAAVGNLGQNGADSVLADT